MNKKLVAVAVAAGLALPMVSAHAVDVADKKLEVYGKLHVAVQSNDDALDSTNDNVQVNSIDSRLGFKGAVPLNGGLTGTYKFEFGVGIADESSEDYDITSAPTAGVNDTISVANESGITRRNMYVGLKGGFGEVRLGRHDSPLKMAQGKFDQFGDTVGDLKNAGDEDGENRNDSSITYLGKFDKIAVNVQLIPSEGDGTAAANQGQGISDTTSIAVSYTDGPLYVAVANDSYDGANSAEDSLTRIVATYNMGAMQFGVLSQSGVEAPDTAAAKEDWLGLSFAMKMGNNKLKFQHITVEDSATTALESTQTTFGIDHKLGKKATVYAMYNTIEEKNAATTKDESQLSVGYILKF